MDRAHRRMALRQGRAASVYSVEALDKETAVRGRTGRKTRALLRRLQPVAMVTPRWSAPQGFLEDLALDLAVGEPRVACRTVSMRPVMGRTEPEAWNFLLRVLAEMGGPDAARRPVPMVCARAGFRHAADHLFDRAHDDAEIPVALLAHGTEHLPVDVMTDLAEAWSRYSERVGDQRRCTMLLAGSVALPVLAAAGAAEVELGDYSASEAAATMVLQMGPVPYDTLSRAAAFSGGIPALVHALAAGVTEHAILPENPDAMLRCMGAKADELRFAVAMALTSQDSADRFYELADGARHSERVPVDTHLRLAGLIRRAGAGARAEVILRSPAMAAVAT